jgi:phosphate transport system substrate-binding protein
MKSTRRWLLFASLALYGGNASAQSVIHGAGATFPAPIYTKWAADYRAATGIDVQYDAVGSGAGIERIEQSSVDFGASDIPLSPEDLQRHGLSEFPAVIGGVVPVINITGIRSGELKLSGEVLAEIYLGRIRKWNAAAIAELNPGLNLPSANITVVHRADASGSTFLLSEFLSRSSAAWQTTLGRGSTLAWRGGVAAAGNEGVASSVQRTRMAIGYVEYAYARQHRLTTVSLRNHAGRFVQAGVDGFRAAAESARWQNASDLHQSLIDQPGAASWPITAASFVLLRNASENSGENAPVRQFFDWAFEHRPASALQLDYLPMPDAAIALMHRDSSAAKP